ncbi:hypothetical protein [Serratia proteamaculans]|uniref:hypothetical protein n=1 Tax=Serratia proteamaculans TaxID=28151 RepID=UPI00101E9B47|nr:hypothetical protein [Serratia proteamaculans]RYM47277.1 hypothetical protein BSQ97_25040 [Serratia proteamaculans]
MDNKLSELSKPVAYTDADELRFNHATSDMWPIPLGFGKDAPLYSQEYVSALLAELEAKDKRIAELEDDKRQLNEIVNSEANRANTAEKRITEMEFNELNLIAERDNAENVVANMYRAATGDSPEWSNWFRFADAIEEVAQIRANLEASKKSNAFLKEQLSQLANFNPDWDMLEACRDSWREVSAALKEAETRLATPVQPPELTGDEDLAECVFKYVAAIRAAGFTVEGDE